MESPEIMEILMKDDSDEELEELNELIEGSQNVSSPPPSPSDEEEVEIEFRHRRGTDTASIHEFTGLQIVSVNQLFPISHLKPLHLQSFFFSSVRFL
jgi:hypothetical protein